MGGSVMDFTRYAPSPAVEPKPTPIRTAFALVGQALALLAYAIFAAFLVKVWRLRIYMHSVYIAWAFGGAGWGMAFLFGIVAVLLWFKVM